VRRPKEFDREEALRRAIRVFWENGFAGTSTDDLVRAMGIGRQSLYDTFGDKRGLFLAALRVYNTDSLTRVFRKLREGPTALAALERIPIDRAEASKQRSRGLYGGKLHLRASWRGRGGGRVEPNQRRLAGSDAERRDRRRPSTGQHPTRHR
jgi:AcrR family transcriptional regulator